MLLPEFI